ncbi:MAG TPA: lytic transglycosylase domain-containing protein [Longimicrobiales bacterium]|nr:lytic transglycosylase domain-containing protein [Longimicrobiales bacterium]
MSDSQQDPQLEAPARRAYVSPPPGGPDRVSELLFQWETRHFSPVRRALVTGLRRARRAGAVFALAATLILFGAAVANEPEAIAETRSVEDQLRRTQQELVARQGELELARLELNRLSAIVEQSRQHRIPADLAVSIYDIARAEGVDPALAFSLVRVESGFTKRAISSAGAVGLTQVMPSTAFWLQPGVSYTQLFEEDTNLRLGFRYLRMMLEQYDGDLRLALLAYNRGPGTVDGILARGGDPGNGYARRVSGPVRQ